MTSKHTELLEFFAEVKDRFRDIENITLPSLVRIVNEIDEKPITLENTELLEPFDRLYDELRDFEDDIESFTRLILDMKYIVKKDKEESE